MNINEEIAGIDAAERAGPTEFLKRTTMTFAILILVGGLSALPSYANYSTPNTTGVGGAFDYSKTVMTTATGSPDAFGLMIVGTIFICFYVIGSRYTQERALVYSTFMTVMVAFLLASGNFLDAKWLILSIIGLLVAVYLANRIG
jgi:hypothetical protein